MKKEIIGILVCTLLIAATVLPVAGNVNIGKSKEREGTDIYTYLWQVDCNAKWEGQYLLDMVPVSQMIVIICENGEAGKVAGCGEIPNGVEFHIYIDWDKNGTYDWIDFVYIPLGPTCQWHWEKWRSRQKGVVASGRPPEPDLDCEGSLDWIDVQPGDTVYGDVMVKNIGDPESLLDWEIIDWPKDWGAWKFTPISGIDLTPEDGTVTVNVSVVAPTQKNKEFTGEIKIVNKENTSDNCTITINLKTPKNKSFNYNFPMLNWLFEHFPNVFPIIKYILGLQNY